MGYFDRKLYRVIPVLLLMVLTACASPAGDADAGHACTQAGGEWQGAYQECLGVGMNTCDSLQGTYQECASPCRHNPDAQVCILRCDQVCQLK